MRHRRIFIIITIFGCCSLLYSLRFHLSFGTSSIFIPSSQIYNRIPHIAIILARQPSIRVLKHLNVLVKAGIDAYVMCDNDPSKYTNLTEYINLMNRVLFISDENLAQYSLTRNRVWDRVFVWLYNQHSMEYVWIMEDDVTWSHVQHMVDFFNKYANSSADLLSKDRIHKYNDTSGWIYWPQTPSRFFPENKWAGSFNVITRVSRRLINAHQYYTQLLFNETRENPSSKIDRSYYFQEFFTPAVANMFNLTTLMYDRSNMYVYFGQLREDNIRAGLVKGLKIFHAVKHDSELFINATQY